MPNLVKTTWVDQPDGGRVARVLIDDPRRLNAMGRDLMADFLREIEAVSLSDDCRCVVVEGDGGRAFVGGANSYRVMDRNWQLQRDKAHAEVTIPTLFVGGAEDPVIKLAGDAPFAHMREKVNDLRTLELLPGAGHFIQQERPDLLNPLLLQFLRSL